MNENEVSKRNRQLEKENEQLYQKIHSLMSENGSLKSSMSQFRHDLQSEYEKLVSKSISPSKERENRLKKLKEENSNLKSVFETYNSRLKALLSRVGLNNGDSFDFLQSLQKVEEIIGKGNKDDSDEKDAQIEVLRTENQALMECNQRFEQEREQLTSTLTTYRDSLKAMKEALISSDTEKKKMKDEIIRLKRIVEETRKN